MRVPFSWLQDYLPNLLSPEQCASFLQSAGIEVDRIDTKSVQARGTVVAQIIDLKPHPNANRLHIATVDDGKCSLKIICGAPNCRVGMKTAFAPIGATVCGEGGTMWTIEETIIRKISSYGMLCSAQELGLSEKEEGILECEADVPLGTPLSSLYPPKTYFNLSFTPNLGHCLSLFGLVRKIAPFCPGPPPSPPTIPEICESPSPGTSVHIEVEEQEWCDQYYGRLIKNVRVAPSPPWLKNRLKEINVHPVNNVIDLLQYVMFELGQPLHVLDWEKAQGNKIRVRYPDHPSTFLASDSQTYQISDVTLMIYDQERPMAIAGLIEGEEYAVTMESSHLFIGAASFHPSAIRRSVQQLGIRNGSSMRFERGVDQGNVLFALDRATALIREIAGGVIMQTVSFTSPLPPSPEIVCRFPRVNQLLGTHLSHSMMEDMLVKLSLHICKIDAETVKVTPPTNRRDITSEIDLVREIALLYGYHRIPKKGRQVTNSSLPLSPLFLMEGRVRRQLLSEGLQEFLTCDLISPTLAEIVLDHSPDSPYPIQVLHPSSSEQSILRPSLLPGLLHSVRHNFDQHHFSISAFEIGHIHFKTSKERSYKERATAGLILTGNVGPNHWGGSNREVDFYDLKGILDNLFASLNIEGTTLIPSDFPTFHPGRQGTIHCQSIRLGSFGEVHPKHLAKMNIEQRLFFAQLDLHDLLSLQQTTKIMVPLPLYPGSTRDWTIVIDHRTMAIDVLKAIQNVSSPLFKKCSIIDLYVDPKANTTHRHLTLRLLYRDDHSTLSQHNVDQAHAHIQEKVREEMGEKLLKSLS